MIWHPLHSDLPRPQALNNPFCYEPDPLCRLAAEEVKAYLSTQTDWQEEIGNGKMMGVLVCENAQGELGFLAAYSGQIAGREDHTWFVPAVFDYLQPDGYFKREEAEISAINHHIAALESASDYVSLKAAYERFQTNAQQDIEAYKMMMREAKARRDALRQKSALGAIPQLELLQESQFQKAELRRLKKAWQARLTEAEAQLKQTENQIQRLKQERKQRSDALQRWLFDHFEMLNAQGERRTLSDIFRISLTPRSSNYPHSTLHTPHSTNITPPSGSGECCAPKLLQYAFLHHLRPLCIAEFWQGRSPRMEIRHHDHYYPACRGKCKPILEWMLGSDIIKVKSDKHFSLIMIHCSESFLVVNKPAGLLSVPGLTDEESVESMLREHYGDIFMVHRLDQDTSGLMVVARTAEAYHHLQRQFLTHTVYKRYVAVLDGTVTGSGTISLPLRPDIMDRPRQLVDYEHGKPAVTDYDVLSTSGGRTLIALTPLSGRTHQLRVHCAHPDGLGVPILGDRLYGQSADRLYLHAETLSFNHPDTSECITFNSPISARHALWSSPASL